MDVVIDIAQESVRLIVQTVQAGSDGTEEAKVQVITLLRLQCRIGIDGGTVAQQFTGQRQSHAVLITGLDRQRRHQLELRSHTAS